MPELRHDPIQKRWVIIAAERGRRPTDFPRQKAPAVEGYCPFCEGREASTPPEIASHRVNGSPPNQPGWRVRVVPNMFPALRIEGDFDRRGVGVHDRMNGIGAHEVIIETPAHDENMADMPVDQLERVLAMYRQRLTDLARDGRFKYILIFKNHGEQAGASLSHPHTQIIATPVTPLILAEELASARAHYRQKERCLFCDVIRQEVESGERVAAGTEHFVAITPFASRFPFEVALYPRRHQHSFAETSDELLRDLAVALRDVLIRLRRCLDDPPYNFLVHTIPNVHAAKGRSSRWDTLEADYHWHIEIIPRVTRIAGFEWGTGFYINPTAPEDAAKHLRGAH